MHRKIAVERAYGPVVEGEALVSEEGFSPRYDLDRWTGLITKHGHKLEGLSIVDKVCFFPTAKGGIAAGWSPAPHGVVRTGDWVRVDPARKTIEVLR